MPVAPPGQESFRPGPDPRHLEAPRASASKAPRRGRHPAERPPSCSPAPSFGEALPLWTNGGCSSSSPSPKIIRARPDPIAGALRWLHPGQQQGPALTLLQFLLESGGMRRFSVISCLASSTQQMNSLRARGVMSSGQATSAVGLAISASRRSPGSLCPEHAWHSPDCQEESL